MFFNYHSVDVAQLGAGRLEVDAGRQPAEELRHPMDPSGHHGCREMVRAGHDVCYYLGFRWIRHRRFQDAHNSGRAIAEPDSFADHGWIAIELRRPETI